jgi:hypothetical protein
LATVAVTVAVVVVFKSASAAEGICANATTVLYNTVLTAVHSKVGLIIVPQTS